MADHDLTGILRDMFAWPPSLPARPPVRLLTPADRLELIADTVTDLQITEDANGDRLENITRSLDTNGCALTDILGVLEDIRGLLITIADQGAHDE